MPALYSVISHRYTREHKVLDMMLRFSPDTLHTALNLSFTGRQWRSWVFYLPCFWEPLFGNSWRTRLVVEAKIPMPLCAFSWRLSFLMNWSLIEVCVLSGDIAGSPLSDFCFQQQSGLMAQRHIEINPSSCLYRSVWLQHTMLCISMSSHNSHCTLHEVKFATVCRCKCCTSWQAY